MRFFMLNSFKTNADWVRGREAPGRQPRRTEQNIYITVTKLYHSLPKKGSLSGAFFRFFQFYEKRRRNFVEIVETVITVGLQIGLACLLPANVCSFTVENSGVLL